MSIMPTACFLLALIGCISAQFSHSAPRETARRGRNKRLSCTVDSSVTLSSTAIHWYRQKPEEALQRLLYFGAGASTATIEDQFSRRFTGGKKDSTLSLTITSVSDDDAATYYCALWRGDTKVFSSGIRLYVTDGSIKTPKLSAFPASSTQSNGKRVLLCQARNMVPDFVKFTWHAEDQSGTKVDLKSDEQLEQRDDLPEVKITSMLIVDKQKVKTNKFTCSVLHDSSIKEVKRDIPRQQDEEKPDPDPVPATTCPTPKEKEQQQEVKEEDKEEEETPIYGLFELRRSLHLFSVVYVILLVKNVLYFCTVSVLLYKRNAANKEMLRSKAH
ncbi:hypothetical protein PHYPO_G00196760 [Pangasianodon hypophthalmus]|uniref:Ig-like domain-containing protein n=1 Tax=Pangasianodon hypophthalmus TaxID=310915 RepID=A0A5N5PIX4_PANHP|nr:hypothetical protein PHYPO_G00196760 [Pangasianodon hypophthalmus]